MNLCWICTGCRLLKEFAERGSIAATAAALGYTPSAVSQQLAALEREAGAALLDRTARSAELTDAGLRLRARRAHPGPDRGGRGRRLGPGRGLRSGPVAAFPTAAVAFAPR